MTIDRRVGTDAARRSRKPTHRLTDSERALRDLLRRSRPSGARVALAELDAYYLAERLREAEPHPVSLRFRETDGAAALEAVAGTPVADARLREAGITEQSDAAAVRLLTLKRFAAALEFLAAKGIETACTVDGPDVLIATGNPLLPGLPLGLVIA